jgi:hypothetical protein
MDVLLVIAGTYQHAQFYAREHGLRPREWRHVTELHQVQGVNTGRYVVLDYDAPQVWALLDHLRRCEAIYGRMERIDR